MEVFGNSALSELMLNTIQNNPLMFRYPGIGASDGVATTPSEREL